MPAETYSAVKEVGIWTVIVIGILFQLLIPITNKILPGAVKHARAMDERRVKADEKVAEAIVVGNERLNGFEKLLLENNKTLTELVRGVSILIDRREREPDGRKKNNRGLFE